MGKVLAMAKVIEDSPELWTGTRTGRHPWKTYLNGQTWVLEHGVDFTSAPLSMRAAASAAANKLGVSVRTRIDDNKLIIKAVPKPVAPAEEPAEDAAE